MQSRLETESPDQQRSGTELKLKVQTNNVLEDEKLSLLQISKQIANRKNGRLELNINGTKTSETKKNKQALESHFKALFEKDNVFHPGVANILNSIDKYLSLADRECLNASITIDEIELALKQATKKKSPGPDGLSYELYSTFFEELQDDLLKLFNCFKSGSKPDPSFTGKHPFAYKTNQMIHKQMRNDP